MNRLALPLLVAVVLIWGANWPILKLGVTIIPPLWLGIIRLVLGALVLAAIIALSGTRPSLPPRGDLPLVVTVGVLQMAGFTATMNVGLLYVDAGRSAILAYTTPLWVAPGAVLLLREPLGRMGVLGVALGLGGVAALFDPTSFDWSDRTALTGNGLLLLAALLWAGAILHVRSHRWRTTALALAPWQMLLGATLLLPLALAIEGVPQPIWTPFAVFVVAYNAILATAFGFWAVVTLTRMLPAVTASLAFLGVPAAGLLFSAWWLDEPLGYDKLVALVLVAAGVAAVSSARR